MPSGEEHGYVGLNSQKVSYPELEEVLSKAPVDPNFKLTPYEKLPKEILLMRIRQTQELMKKWPFNMESLEVEKIEEGKNNEI